MSTEIIVNDDDKMTIKDKPIQFNVRIDEEESKMLMQISRKLKNSMSGSVRYLIANYFEKMKRNGEINNAL